MTFQNIVSIVCVMGENFTKDTLDMIQNVDHYLKGVRLPLLGKKQSLRQLKAGAKKVRLVYLLKLRTVRNLHIYLKMDQGTYKRLANRYTRIIKMMDFILSIPENDML